MATTIGKGDRYRPGQPYSPQPYIGGFMPNVVPDQVVSKSPFAGPATVPTGWIDQSFASLPNLSFPQPAAVPEMPTATAYAPQAPANPAVAAATGAANPVTNVTGKMQDAPHSGLLSLLFGPSKNGLSGLAGLVGGPQAGGLLGMLMQQRPQAAAPGAPGALSSAQQYAALNAAARDRAAPGTGGSSGNITGINANGNFYDLDRNEWRRASSGSSGGGSRNNEYLGASN